MVNEKSWKWLEERDVCREIVSCCFLDLCVIKLCCSSLAVLNGNTYYHGFHSKRGVLSN
jgi:hypothetical protein